MKKDKTGEKQERKQRIMMADIRESVSAVHSMAKTDKEVAELKRKLKIFTDEIKNENGPLEKILKETF